ncbi:MAG: 3-dehydroquinate synthase [Gemmatimonadales bacterium]|nr:3-dehydroquinate synthase [Gemmatimonadales bacterium]MYG49420.1 3-dehydroquinate synthase [Gemmatimonadales bacterium]MYK02245.1 3-dehydroquinate synthase [Candidatus Palauibacter ramosifaciens]
MSVRTLEVGTGGGGYPIRIAPGLLADVGTLCRSQAPAHRYAVIADSQVARLYGPGVVTGFDDAGIDATLIPFPAGEWNKSRDQWAAVSDRMLREGFGRDSAVVALGGGVTGDLAGFVAATYMRGIPVIQIPTTLLAMLDSSVGGKTGVDTEAGKNLIGAFHHPSAVLIDPAVLETLPRHQRCAGLAEAVKTAAILDLELWDWMVAGASALSNGDSEASSELIERVVRHKAAVVGDDPLERDRREILNFGHTVGHALEALEGYKLLHGEAVAAGMRVESRLGELLGVTERGTSERLAVLLEACGLGGDWEADREPTEIRDAMSKDKKARLDRIRCVFLSRIGEVATDADGRHSFGLGDEDLGQLLATALRSAPGV